MRDYQAWVTFAAAVLPNAAIDVNRHLGASSTDEERKAALVMGSVVASAWADTMLVEYKRRFR